MTSPNPLANLPQGLSAVEVSRRLGISYQSARGAIERHGYKTVDGRKSSQWKNRKLTPDHLDPSMSTVQIARKVGVSKQRVSFLAKQLGVTLKDTRGKCRKSTGCACGRSCQRRDC